MSLNLNSGGIAGPDNGGGVPKSDTDEGSFAHALRREIREEPEPAAPAPAPEGLVIVESLTDKFIKDGTGHKTHWYKAFYKGQSKDNGHFSFSHQHAEVLDLSTSSGLSRYNELLQMAGAPGADPQIHICSNRTEYHDGRFLVLIHYVDYWYLAPEQR